MNEALAAALASRGIGFRFAATRSDALREVVSLIPAGANVMNGGSATLEEIGFLELLRAGRYAWLRPAIVAAGEREERTRRRRQA
ncbi:MAG TPA: LUD domain-containing protein, partial [Burkholderiales bacterium]|nr:LUD domain-containing protein [Burkholderiales bacterium]